MTYNEITNRLVEIQEEINTCKKEETTFGELSRNAETCEESIKYIDECFKVIARIEKLNEEFKQLLILKNQLSIISMEKS